MKKRKLLVIEIVILIIVLLILGMSFLKEGNKEKNQNDKMIEKVEEESQNDNTIEVEEEIECIELKTPYATLRVQKEWTDKLRMEIVEGDIYKVEFYGTLEGKGEIHLNDIAFGGEEGNTIGFMEVEGEKVPVNMIYFAVEEGKYTDDELIEIQEMQRAVEFVMDELVQMEEFEWE